MRRDRLSARLSPGLVGAILIAIAMGFAAIVLPYIEAGVRPSVPEALVGWSLIGSGFVLVGRGSSPASWLIVASGVAWFVVDFAPLLSGAPREVLEAAALAYLALLAHGVLAMPSCRVDGWVGKVAVAVVYVVAVAAGLGYYRFGLVVAGAAISLAAVHRRARSHGGGARGARAALGAGLVLGSGVCATAFLRLSAPGVSEQVLTRGLFLSIVVASVLAASAGSTRPIDGTRLDLGIAPVSAFESAIGAALGRDAITVRFPAADGRWINPAGDFVGVEVDRMEMIGDDAQGEHVLAALGDSGGVGADVPGGLRDLLRLAGAQARLQVQVRSRLHELADSRRRLLDAGDAQRRQLERQLRDGALARVAMVETLVGSTEGLDPLRERVATTRTELDGVACGIDPLAGRSLHSALEQIAARSAFKLTVDAPEIELPAYIARAVWYTCSEAVANATKHAPDASVSITLRDDNTAIMLRVEDDGPGGADPDGWGLRGLADRAAALGGSLSVDTSPAGTLIELRIPLSDER